jgi:hypothetical protein
VSSVYFLTLMLVCILVSCLHNTASIIFILTFVPAYWYPTRCYDTILNCRLYLLRLGILILSNMVLYHHLTSYRSPSPTHTDNSLNQPQYRYQGLIQNFFVEGGNSRVRYRTQTSGVWGHAPPENFCSLLPLRLFLVASETTYTNKKLFYTV